MKATKATPVNGSPPSDSGARESGTIQAGNLRALRRDRVENGPGQVDRWLRAHLLCLTREVMGGPLPPDLQILGRKLVLALRKPRKSGSRRSSHLS